MKPRIVQICALDSTMYKMLDKLNQASIEEGYEVHCICSDGEYLERLRNKGYKVHAVNIDRRINIKSNFNTINDIYQKLKDIRPDIVHVHTPVAAVLGRIAAKLARVKTVIYTAHGFYFHEGMSKKKYKAFYNIEKYMGKFFTDYIFTQSEEDFLLAKNSEFLRKSKQNNYLHISNGIDINTRFNIDNYYNGTREKLLSSYNISHSSLIISFVGRMVREKGIIDLIESLKKLENIEDIHLLAIGGLSESERDKSLTKYLNEDKKISNITFTGRIDNVEDFLYSSDIFILPSYREGMPRSIIEAMSMKNAIIATNIRGSREEVVNKYNGFLVDTNSPDQIKDRILDLYNNPKTLIEFQNNSFKRAKSLYDEDDVVKKQLNIFNEVIS